MRGRGDRPQYWILIGQTAVPMDPQPDGDTPEGVQALLEWSSHFEMDERRVMLDDLGPGYSVSTVFLGIDHGWLGPEPLLFETAVAAGGSWDIVGRWSTWAEAEEGHKAAVVECRAAREKALRG